MKAMLENSERLSFDQNILSCVAGGKSVLDIQRLHISDLKEAERFIQSYGFDLSQEKTVEKLWYFYRRAFVLLTERLGYSLDEIPEKLRDRKHLKDLRELLVMASLKDKESKPLRRWSCALLRCMHVYVHHESDLFHSFSEEIQKQILTPFEQVVFHDGTTHKTYLRSLNQSRLENIELHAFIVKALKSSSSSVVKLLAKPEAFTIRLLDHVGVRLVTKNVFDAFRVIRFLVNEGVISYPQIIADQTTNNIFPIERFMELMDEFLKNPNLITDQQLDKAFEEHLQKEQADFGLFKKENKYSGEGHRFIKFIVRRLIRIQDSQDIKPFQFFFPFEVQIMDEKSYAHIQTGPAAHEEYKKRQNEAAKKRIFPKDED